MCKDIDLYSNPKCTNVLKVQFYVINCIHSCKHDIPVMQLKIRLVHVLTEDECKYLKLLLVYQYSNLLFQVLHGSNLCYSMLKNDTLAAEPPGQCYWLYMFPQQCQSLIKCLIYSRLILYRHLDNYYWITINMKY